MFPKIDLYLVVAMAKGKSLMPPSIQLNKRKQIKNAKQAKWAVGSMFRVSVSLPFLLANLGCRI